MKQSNVAWMEDAGRNPGHSVNWRVNTHPLRPVRRTRITLRSIQATRLRRVHHEQTRNPLRGLSETDGQSWLNLQAYYDMEITRENLTNVLESIAPYREAA